VARRGGAGHAAAMRTVPLVVLAAAFAAACSTPDSASSTASGPAGPATQPLWNGVDLAGWHGQRHESPYKLAAMATEARAKLRADDDATMRAHWRVVAGELVNDGEGAYLTTDRDYGDAEFELEYKTVAKADSGIYLRGSPQVQIWDFTEAGGKWKLGADKGSGGLWNNEKHERFPPQLADRPFGEWNRLRIRQVGARTWVWLNGVATVDGAGMENFWDRKKPLPRTGPLHAADPRRRNPLAQRLGARTRRGRGGQVQCRRPALKRAGFTPPPAGRASNGQTPPGRSPPAVRRPAANGRAPQPAHNGAESRVHAPDGAGNGRGCAPVHPAWGC